MEELASLSVEEEETDIKIKQESDEQMETGYITTSNSVPKSILDII